MIISEKILLLAKSLTEQWFTCGHAAISTATCMSETMCNFATRLLDRHNS